MRETFTAEKKKLEWEDPTAEKKKKLNRIDRRNYSDPKERSSTALGLLLFFWKDTPHTINKPDRT
jgi:hypothetical protein